jgi:hypothetical protein
MSHVVGHPQQLEVALPAGEEERWIVGFLLKAVHVVQEPAAQALYVVKKLLHLLPGRWVIAVATKNVDERLRPWYHYGDPSRRSS